jgi:hypothetical protein
MTTFATPRRALPGAIALAALFLGAGCSSTADTPSNGVNNGVGSQDASADAKITTCTAIGSGLASGKVSITNHSSKRSDYFISVVFIAADGSQVGDGLASATAVEPNQRALADLTGAPTAKFATCKIVTVQRTASS